VMFRHEKKFVNSSAIAVAISDTESDDSSDAKIAAVLESEIDRVGQKLRVDAIAIMNDSNDKGKLEALAQKVAQKAPNVPVIVCTENADAADAALKSFNGKKPLLYGITDGNADAMAAVAKNNKASAGIKANDLDALTALSEKVKGLGVDDIVIDPLAANAREMIEKNTLIRRAATKKNFKPLGYPVINFVQRDDSLLETIMAGLGIMKYSSIIVINSIEKWKDLALFTLRQNIYTDPQVPMQVEQKVYKIGDAKSESPLLITTNFSLTYFIVSGEVENSKVPTHLAVMDCEGLSVLTAWAAGKFTASKIAQFIKESGIENEVSHRELILPGYVAILSGAIEEKLDGWKVTVGPREANALPAFLKGRAA